MSTEQIHKTLTNWGATPHQIEVIFPKADQSEMEQRANHITAIDECLRLLYREHSAQKNFMNRANKSMFFNGRKPLAVISSGKLDDLAQAHQVIRSMVCI